MLFTYNDMHCIENDSAVAEDNNVLKETSD